MVLVSPESVPVWKPSAGSTMSAPRYVLDEREGGEELLVIYPKTISWALDETVFVPFTELALLPPLELGIVPVEASLLVEEVLLGPQ